MNRPTEIPLQDTINGLQILYEYALQAGRIEISNNLIASIRWLEYFKEFDERMNKMIDEIGREITRLDY